MGAKYGTVILENCLKVKCDKFLSHLYYDLGTWYVDIFRRKMKACIYKNSYIIRECSYNCHELEMTVVYSSSENLSSNKEE